MCCSCKLRIVLSFSCQYCTHFIFDSFLNKQQRIDPDDRNVSEFEKMNRVGEGTYGVVYRARDTKSGEIVALGRVLQSS